MRLAVVAGGWHYPAHFYRALADQTIRADLFLVATVGYLLVLGLVLRRWARLPR